MYVHLYFHITSLFLNAFDWHKRAVFRSYVIWLVFNLLADTNKCSLPQTLLGFITHSSPHGGGTHDESLRESVGEATINLV